MFWAYVGRGIVYTVRALDNFLVLYDGLPEIKPEAAVRTTPGNLPSYMAAFLTSQQTSQIYSLDQ